jgi:hypothetical protein
MHITVISSWLCASSSVVFVNTTMGSSTDSSSQQLSDPPGPAVSSEGMSDPCLQAALLRHPSMQACLQDQRTLAALLQTSREVQAAVAQHSAGQLQLTLQPTKLQQVEGIANWMHKHGGLLKELAVDLTIENIPQDRDWDNCDSRSSRHWADAAASNLGAGMQQAAAAAGSMQLRCVSLSGAAAGPAAILQQLSAARLTRLQVEAALYDSSSMQAIAALSGLCSLDLRCLNPRGSIQSPLPEMQQLTRLQLGPVKPNHLSCLQPLLPGLQQLHLIVAVCFRFEELFVLAEWLKQHLCTVSSLKVDIAAGYDPSVYDHSPIDPQHVKADGLWAVVAALQDVAAAAAAPADAAASLTADAILHHVGLQLQSFSMCMTPNGDAAIDAWPEHFMWALPARSVTHLECPHLWDKPAQVSALCRLTALQSCVLPDPWTSDDLNYYEESVLAQLSVLQQLTSLDLDVPRRQLAHLPQLPQLPVLRARIMGEAVRQPLQLGHLTSLVRLVMADMRVPLLAADQLPPNLR